MKLHHQQTLALTRRHFLKQCQVGLGAIAFESLSDDTRAAETPSAEHPLAPRKPHFAAKAKNVIYLHMSGAPPQQELFDYKPKLVEHNMQACPEEWLKNQRFPFIKGHPKLLGTPYKFAQHGECGAWVSELLPNLSTVIDDVAFIKTMHTDQFNHAPAELFLYTGNSQFGSAAMGSWITYGLGSENQDLPGI